MKWFLLKNREKPKKKKQEIVCMSSQCGGGNDGRRTLIYLTGGGNQILGADMHHLADAVVRGFEARVNNPPREGFSQQALLARLEILRGARDTLADPELRADYNQALVEDEAGTLVLDVPWTKVKNSILFSSLLFLPE